MNSCEYVVVCANEIKYILTDNPEVLVKFITEGSTIICLGVKAYAKSVDERSGLPKWVHVQGESLR